MKWLLLLLCSTALGDTITITNVSKVAKTNMVMRWSGPSNTVFQIVTKTNTTAQWQTVGSTTNFVFTNAMTKRFSLFSVLSTNTQPGQFVFSKYITGPLTADVFNPFSVRVAANITMGGAFSGTMTFAGVPLTSGGDFDAFLSQYTTDGALRWAKRMGGTAGDYGYNVAIDQTGNVFITGGYSGTSDFGGGPLVGAGGGDIFLAKYSSTGTHIWSKRFGGTGTDTGNCVAIDNTGNVVIIGWFGDGFAEGREVDFGGGPLASVGSYDVFCAKFNSAGTHIWSRRLGGTHVDRAKTLAIDANNDVMVGIEFNGTADLGGGALVSAGTADIGLVKYAAANGAHIWSKRFGGTKGDVIAGMALDNGNIVLSGTFQDAIDFGGGVLTTVGTADFYMAKLSSTGSHTWSKRFTSGQTGRDGVFGLAIDSHGNIGMTGAMLSAMSLGGAALVGQTASIDTFLAKFNSSGAHLWSVRYGGYFDDWASSIAVDSTDSIYAVGQFYGSMQFGQGEQINQGGYDGYIGKFAP